MRAQIEKTTFTCKDDFLLTKRTRTYSALLYFLDEKSDFQKANFQHFRIFARIDDFSKISQGYNF